MPNILKVRVASPTPGLTALEINGLFQQLTVLDFGLWQMVPVTIVGKRILTAIFELTPPGETIVETDDLDFIFNAIRNFRELSLTCRLEP